MGRRPRTVEGDPYACVWLQVKSAVQVEFWSVLVLPGSARVKVKVLVSLWFQVGGPAVLLRFAVVLKPGSGPL